jgi:phosphoglycolate phosphatase
MPLTPVPKLVVFDLDGTLVDSLRDIAESMNACLELLGLPQRPVSEYQYMVGEGVPALCRRAIGDSHPYYLNRLIELARPRYRVRSLVHTSPYDGICEVVTKIRQCGVPLGALSNKPHDMTDRMVRTFWPNGEFEFVQGYIEERYRKPDPHHLLHMCIAAGVEPAEACLVGDTPTDVLTARNAGAAMIGVTWGFRTRADLIEAGATRLVASPDQLLVELGLSA